MKRFTGKYWLAGNICVIFLMGSAASFADPITYYNDFESGLVGETLYGDAVLEGGSIRLTEAVNDQQGTLVIPDLAPHLLIASWTANFDLLAGPGSTTPADGISFTFGPQTDFSYGEEGMWRFLTVSFDTFDNGDPDHIGIDVKWHNQYLATSDVDPYTDGAWVPVSVTYDADGTLDVFFDGQAVFTDLQTGYTRIPSMARHESFGFGGRTGAENSVQRIDNVLITVLPEVDSIPMLNRYGLAVLALLILAAGFVGYRRFGAIGSA